MGLGPLHICPAQQYDPRQQNLKHLLGTGNGVVEEVPAENVYRAEQKHDKQQACTDVHEDAACHLHGFFKSLGLLFLQKLASSLFLVAENFRRRATLQELAEVVDRLTRRQALFLTICYPFFGDRGETLAEFVKFLIREFVNLVAGGG